MKPLSTATMAGLLALLAIALGAYYNGPVTLSVGVGCSMWPTIKPGDLVIAVKTGPGGFHPGDIVIYRRGDVFVSHRVIRIIGDVVITKGDNNPVADDPVPVESVRYRVAAVVPPAVWAPLLAGLLVAPGIAYPGQRRLLFLLALLISMALLMDYSGYSMADLGPPVSYSPAPVVSMRVEGGAVAITLPFKPSGVECINCHATMDGSTVLVRVERGETAILLVRPPTNVNITLTFTFHTGS